VILPQLRSNFVAGSAGGGNRAWPRGRRVFSIGRCGCMREREHNGVGPAPGARARATRWQTERMGKGLGLSHHHCRRSTPLRCRKCPRKTAGCQDQTRPTAKPERNPQRTPINDGNSNNRWQEGRIFIKPWDHSGVTNSLRFKSQI
jgi:hypothetical protein